MSSQYPQYPQDPQYAQAPMPSPPQPAQAPAGPAYIPLEQLAPPDVAFPWWQSQQAINRAAMSTALQLMVQVPDASSAQKFPLAVYNKQTRDIHVVKDENEEQKYTGM